MPYSDNRIIAIRFSNSGETTAPFSTVAVCPVYSSETLLPSGNIPPTDMARPSSGFRRISGKGALAVYRDAHKDRRLAIFKDVAPKKECHTE